MSMRSSRVAEIGVKKCSQIQIEPNRISEHWHSTVSHTHTHSHVAWAEKVEWNARRQPMPKIRSAERSHESDDDTQMKMNKVLLLFDFFHQFSLAVAAERKCLWLCELLRASQLADMWREREGGREKAILAATFVHADAARKTKQKKNAWKKH